MPWTELARAPQRKIRWFCIGALLLLLVAPASTQDRRLSVYAPQMYYQVPVADRSGTDYIGLLELLEPFGRVESKHDGKKWILRFTGSSGSIDAEFQNGKRKGKVRGTDFDLSANFSLQGDRGFVPVSSLSNLLPRILERTVDVHTAARRLFLGSVAIKYTQSVKHDPTRLVLNFPNGVSPNIATDGNTVRLTFTRDPVISSGSDSTNFNDAPISTAAFSESNGAAEIIVRGTSPLQAAFSDGCRTISISAAGQSAQVHPQPPAPKPETPLPPPSFPTQTPPAEGPAAKSTPARRGYFVVLDAGHGGDERGAQLTESLNEKDVAMALARRIQHELEQRGIPVTLVRSGEATLTADQRAVSANTARASLYVSVHAATLGTGVRVFTAMLPAGGPPNRRKFVPWDSAQSAYLGASSEVAGAIATECRNRKLPIRMIAAPVVPLNSIVGAAVAIELAPQTDTVESLTDAKYQQSVATSVAAGIANIRAKLEATQ